MDMPWYAFLPIAIVTIVLIFVNGYINMRIGSYSFVPVFYFNVLLSVAVLLNLAKYMFLWFNNHFPNNYLMGIGKNSIVYLVLNQLCILLWAQIVSFFPLPGGGVGVIASKLFVLIGTMITLYICEQLFTKTKLKVIIGK